MTKKKGGTPVSPTSKKRRNPLIILIGLILVAALMAGGWFIYTTYIQSDYPKKELSHVNLDDPVLRFTWEKIPDVYFNLVSANEAMVLMEAEINRINKVGKKYPRQKKIVASERKRWEKNAAKLKGQLLKFQGQTEALYVTFRVNPEKGRAAILEKSRDLGTSMTEVMVGVDLQTEALRRARILPKGIKGIVAKIKQRF